jgi:hypothetical protein
MTTFQNIQLKLAASRAGRLTLHVFCLCHDGKLRWHWRGMVRELCKQESRPVPFIPRQPRRAQSTPAASTFARGVEAIQDTVFLKKPSKCAA